MNNKQHPHHDLIVEWAKDTSKQPQIKTLADDTEWQDCSILAIISNYKFLARFRPREFIKGHWYPCVDEDGDKCVYFHIGNGLLTIVDDGDNSVDERESAEMRWIGKSLGEIKFDE